MSSKAYTISPSNRSTTTDTSLSAILASHLQSDHRPQSMDSRQPETYTQSGLNSPYSTSQYNGQSSEGSSTVDQASAVPYQTGGSDYKPSTTSAAFSSSATPNSEYGLPQSARSSSFPDYVHQRASYPASGTPPQHQQQHQQQHQSSTSSSSQSRYASSAQPQAAAMAQTSSPSLSNMSSGPQSNGHHSSTPNMKSDGHVPIDPSIAQSSPSYPPPPHSYSPYPPQHEMQQYPQAMSYGRPEWAGHYQQPMAYGHAPASSAGAAPNMAAHVARPPGGGHPLSTVYSFVPIPGAQQHKRPRRRYEEIERMYKCGWNGCEKAYGTLNHLNAHVTMQSHGQKRTPEEFKEIRKEWKAKKKDEENQRKQEEERARQEAQRTGQDTSQAPGQPGQYGQHAMMPPQMGGPQLPPIGYQPAGGQAPGQYAQPQQVDGPPQYSNGQMYSAQPYPQSPYAQGGLPYQQQRS